MEKSTSSRHRFVNVIRWTARIITILVIAILLLFIIGEGMSKDNSQGGASTPLINIVMGVLMIGGLALAWKWELAGALISVGGFIGVLIVNPNAASMPGMFLFAIPAILYLLSWGLDKTGRSVG